MGEGRREEEGKEGGREGGRREGGKEGKKNDSCHSISSDTTGGSSQVF